MFGFTTRKTHLVSAEQALPGRPAAMPVAARHAVLGTPLDAPPGPGEELAYFGLGCFWGAERLYWQAPGVVSTAVGYQGGHTPNPTYDEVCSGRTGHTEVVRVVFTTATTSFTDLVKLFFESHDPTQGMGQGNDIGTQYRSAIYTTSEAQQAAARNARDAYAPALAAGGYGPVTTEITPAGPFYFAEDYHQQYLHKVPNGYCPVHATGIACQVG